MKVLSYGSTFKISRDQMIASLACRWFGIASPRLYDLKRAEYRRVMVMLELGVRIPLFPPPPPVLS